MSATIGFQLLKISVGGIVALCAVGILLVLAVVLFFVVFPVGVWWRAIISDAPIPISKLLAMKMRKVNLNEVVVAYITSKKAGINLSIEDLETHVLAGGNIDKVVRAMISAKSANIKLPLQVAKAIDLAGKDVTGIVQSCIVPKVVETPQITAVSKDGVELKAKAHITIKANMGRVLGGADENTIITRVSECLSSTIGSSVNHGAVIENPDVISDVIISKNLDMGTAYEIVSLDIFDITIGKNIAVQLQLEQSEIEKRDQQAKMEERKLEAIAIEQENNTKIQEAKIRAIEAEAEVPKALAKALQEGKISPMDYYDIKNLEADTNLRNMLSGGTKADASNGEQGAKMQPKVKKRPNPFNF